VFAFGSHVAIVYPFYRELGASIFRLAGFNRIRHRFCLKINGEMSMLVFWVVSPCELVSRYQLFGGTYCLHIQPCSFEDGGSLPRGVTTQKTNIDIGPVRT
jgi:hypothetical protein